MCKYDMLRTLREKSNLTQDQCATLFGTSKNSYIRYENGDRMPPSNFMVSVADYYDVSLDYLLGRESTNRSSLSKKDSELLSMFHSFSENTQMQELGRWRLLVEMEK